MAKWQRIYLMIMAVWLMGSVALTRGQSSPNNGSYDAGTAAEVHLIRRELESLKTLLGDVYVQLHKLDGTAEKIDSNEQKLESISQQLDKITEDIYVPNAYKKGYRVHHFRSPLGVYKYDLAGATTRCQEEGMIIATPQQLQVAWQEGMDVCACGWLSDGTRRYPIQYPRNGCGGTTSGVITCGGTLADVYCYN